ncbi:MAG: DUF1573 domain-containing protein [Bacteroidales bacterium]|nr:DUF1573 domain-containing protein [Bacteroidales bacterium]
MKKFILLFSFLLLIVSFNFAQEDKKPAVDNKKAPEISFENTKYDYGQINKGSDGICVFKFTNTGKEPLILTNLRSSCGCTVPTWPKEPINKKKSGEITVKYDTKRIAPFTKTITVYSNAKNSPVRLTITGKVIGTLIDSSIDSKSNANIKKKSITNENKKPIK